jgi:hypothetical protein
MTEQIFICLYKPGKFEFEYTWNAFTTARLKAMH